MIFEVLLLPVPVSSRPSHPSHCSKLCILSQGLLFLNTFSCPSPQVGDKFVFRMVFMAFQALAIVVPHGILLLPHWYVLTSTSFPHSYSQHLSHLLNMPLTFPFLGSWWSCLPPPSTVLLILQSQAHIVYSPECILTYHQMELLFLFLKHIDH